MTAIDPLFRAILKTHGLIPSMPNTRLAEAMVEAEEAEVIALCPCRTCDYCDHVYGPHLGCGYFPRDARWAETGYCAGCEQAHAERDAERYGDEIEECRSVADTITRNGRY